MRIAFAAVLVSATLLVGCGEAPEEDTHGFVKVLFGRSDAEAENPYVGTAEVTIQMAYGDCYQQFYERNPNYAIDGADGAPMFGTEEDGGEGWKDRLCSEDVSALADCEVLGFNQVLDTAKRLGVTYRVNGDLENRVMLFGPIPNTELAECDGGGSPRVRLEGGGTRGLDGPGGNQVWEVSTFSPDEAVPGDGASINIKARRN